MLDSAPQVRLAALLALADMPPSTQAAQAVAAAFKEENTVQDPHVGDALTCAGAVHSRDFLTEVTGLKPALAPRNYQITVIERIAEHYARGAPTETIGSLLTSLRHANPVVISSIISGLARGWPKDKSAQLDAETETILVQVLPKLPPASRGRVVALGTRWGSRALEKHTAELVESCLNQFRNDKESDGNRIAAARQLIEFRPKDEFST